MSGKKNYFHRFFMKEKLLWHKHFIPSFIAAFAMLFIALFTTFTTAEMVLFASFGATAAVLTHMKKNHLTRLHTVIFSYLIAVASGFVTYILNNLFFDFTLPIDIFLIVLITGVGMILFNCFHPPSVGAGISFFLSGTSVYEVIHILIGCLFLFIIIRFLTYILSKHLILREFWQEFKKEF